MARNFSCGVTINLCQAQFSGITYLLDGQVVDFCTIYPYVCMNSCSGTPAGSGCTGCTYSWSSEGSGIASISGSSSNQTVNAFGASPGSTYIDGSVSGMGCYAPLQPSPPATVVAIPVNFRYVSSSTNIYGDLIVQYAWDSSSGRLSDLSSCYISELVTYPGNPTPNYYPPSPPFPTNPYQSPFVSGVTGSDGGAEDDHTVGHTFVKPYSSSNWAATQNYRYTCTGVNNGNNVQLDGPLTIGYSVQGNGAGGWEFVHTKTGVPLSGIINPLP
jgi:hypothetical protein